MLFRKSIISLAVISTLSVPFAAMATPTSSDAYNTIHSYAPMIRQYPDLIGEINSAYPYLNDMDRDQAVAWIHTFIPDWTAPKTAAELAQEGAELTHMNIDRVQPQIDALSHAKEWKAPVAVHVPESEVEAVETPLNVKANEAGLSRVNEALAHVDRYSMRPVSNPDSLDNIKALAHNPLMSGTDAGQRAQHILDVMARKDLADQHHAEAVAPATAPVAEPSQAELKARYAELLDKQQHESAGVVSYEDQIKQLNEQHYQALKVGDQNAANMISQQTKDVEAAKAASDLIHYEIHSSQKVEAQENIDGDQLKRKIINLAEHNEGLNHAARYQGILDSAKYVAPQDETAPVAVPAAAPADAGAVSYESQLNQLEKQHFAALKTGDANAIQYVNNEIANLKAQHGIDLENANRERTFSQAEALAKAEKASPAEQQAITDQKQGEAIARVSHTAAQAAMSAASTSTRLTGDELAQMNRDRTSTQHVDAVEAAKRSIPTPTNGKDGVDGKNGATGAAGKDGITTTITKVEVDQQTRDQVKATTKGMFENRTQINANTGEILSHSRAIADNKAAIDHNSARIDGLNKNFSALRDEVSENKKQASAGTSAAMAMANIPQVSGSQRVAIGAGMGGYDGENALAVGVSFRVSPAITVKATVSDDTQQNVGYGAGVSVGW